MHVRKAAYALISKETTRSIGTRIRSRKQTHVEGFPVRPVDEWHVFKRNKQFPAVIAPFHISLHGEFRLILRRIGISFLRARLCNTARVLAQGFGVLAD